MYYLSLDVTPRWKNPGCRKMKKSLAHIWIEAKDPVKAARRAINYLEQHQWEVHSLHQHPTLICDKEETHGPAGLIHCHIALEQGISLCLTDQ